MISLKAIAGGFAIAGSLALAPLGMGVADAAPPPGMPQVPSVEGTNSGEDVAPGPAAPSPYAAYGGTSVCATPGLYFVNICT